MQVRNSSPEYLCGTSGFWENVFDSLFLACALELLIQTLLSVARKLPVLVAHHTISAKRAHLRENLQQSGFER